MILYMTWSLYIDDLIEKTSSLYMKGSDLWLLTVSIYCFVMIKVYLDNISV